MEQFSAYMNEDQPERPANIANIVAINQGKRPYTAQDPVANLLGIRDVDTHLSGGAVLLDIRSQGEFGGQHIPHSVNVQLTSTEFEQRTARLVDPTSPLILISTDETQAQKALHKMAFIGTDSTVLGYLPLTAWIAEGRETHSVPQCTVHELHQVLEENPETQVLDVREGAEYADGHVPGAVHLSLKAIHQKLDSVGLDPSKRVYVICKGGMRSSSACSLMSRQGFTNLANVTGGTQAWLRAGLATE